MALVKLVTLITLSSICHCQFQPRPYNSYASSFCQVAQVKNGYMLSDRNPVPAGAIVESFCNPGYINTGGGSPITCQANGAFDPPATCKPNPLIDQRTGEPVQSGSQLRCSFDGLDPCQWGSDGNHATPWLEASYIAPQFKWSQRTGSNTQPDEKFAIIYPKGYDTDTLASDPIPCQQSDVSLSFKYWLAGDANFKVCAAPASSGMPSAGNYLWCSEEIFGSDAFNPTRSVSIPAQNEEFKIVFVPSGSSGFVAIDDIQYDADTVKCTNVCEQLNCDFEGGNICQWTAHTPEGGPRKPVFSVRNKRLGNRDTGTKWPSGNPGTKRYAGVLFNPDRGATTSILESPELNVQQPFDIELPLYESTKDMYVQLCIDTLDNCPYSSNTLTSEDEHYYWQRIKETIPAGTRKIFIKAVNAGLYNGAVGIDDILVHNADCS